MEKKKPNLRKQLFNWHMWAGILFSIPVILVSVTAVFIAHEKGLGTKKVLVNAGWLPGYQQDVKDISYFLDDVKAIDVYKTATLYGSKAGLVIEKDGGYSVAAGTEGMEIRDLLTKGDSTWVASKYGLFMWGHHENKLELLAKGDFHGITIGKTGFMASLGKDGIISSQDGVEWGQSTKHLSSAIPSKDLAAITGGFVAIGAYDRLSLEKLVLDIHTGKAFFGKDSMWLWIDLISLSLLLMTVTGIWMWYKRKYGKKSNQFRDNASAKHNTNVKHKTVNKKLPENTAAVRKPLSRPIKPKLKPGPVEEAPVG